MVAHVNGLCTDEHVTGGKKCDNASLSCFL